MFADFNPCDWNYYLSSGSTYNLPEDGALCAVILDDGTVKANLRFDLENGKFISRSGDTTNASEVAEYLEY